MTKLSMNKLRTLATYFGAVALTSPLFAQEIPKEATPEAIIDTITKAAAEAEAKNTPAMDPAESKLIRSYGLGYQNGEQFGAYGFIDEDIDKEAYITGLIASMSGKDFGKDEDSFQRAMTEFQKIITDREIAIAKANEAAEKEFLEKNSKREGVITTASKLQYEILTKGTGKTYVAPAQPAGPTGPAGVQMPDQTTEFLINCKGTLLDGSIIMETPEGEPFPFDLNVLPGIAEALQLMPVGSKWKVYIPSTLAFGEQRQGPKIAPNSTLIYEIELTDIQKKAAPQMPAFPQMPQTIVPR